MLIKQCRHEPFFFHFPQLKLQVKKVKLVLKAAQLFFPSNRYLARKKKKLAAVNTDSWEEHPRNNMSWDTDVPRVNEETNTQVSKQIKRRILKKLYQKIRQTVGRIVGAFSKLDEFLLSLYFRVQSVELPGVMTGKTWNRTKNHFQDDPNPEVDTLVNRPLILWTQIQTWWYIIKRTCKTRIVDSLCSLVFAK